MESGECIYWKCAAFVIGCEGLHTERGKMLFIGIAARESVGTDWWCGGLGWGGVYQLCVFSSCLCELNGLFGLIQGAT